MEVTMQNLKAYQDLQTQLKSGQKLSTEQQQKVLAAVVIFFGANEQEEAAEPGENPLEMLRDYDTVILVDDSASMKKYWDQVRTAVITLAKIAEEYDPNGIDIRFLHNKRRNLTNVTHEGHARIEQLFGELEVPEGRISLLGKELERLIGEYQAKFAEEADVPEENRDIRPINYIVFTDGRSTDNIEQVIRAKAKQLDRDRVPLSQVGIQFVQLGNDPVATAMFQRLDNKLEDKYDIRDMVDTRSCPNNLGPEEIADILLGGINRNYDSVKTHSSK